MAFHEIKVQDEVAPNLVPMIDIMFLLLLFFMLNADMSARELEEVAPPIAISATEDKAEQSSDGSRITLNVHHTGKCQIYDGGSTTAVCRDQTHWRISVSGQAYPLDPKGMDGLTAILTELGNLSRDKPGPGETRGKSKRSMIIRADKTAPYGYIQQAMECSGKAMVYKIEVAAAIPKDSLKR